MNTSQILNHISLSLIFTTTILIGEVNSEPKNVTSQSEKTKIEKKDQTAPPPPDLFGLDEGTQATLRFVAEEIGKLKDLKEIGKLENTKVNLLFNEATALGAIPVGGALFFLDGCRNLIESNTDKATKEIPLGLILLTGGIALYRWWTTPPAQPTSNEQQKHETIASVTQTQQNNSDQSLKNK